MEKIHIVVGTAGHIDHGKTALIRALTGIDTDRLEEEKRRGISIDLGFAHLGNLGFIDVPGHERFVKNMLAGASGIDLVMLVIAAGESIKPQTREHFEICRLLGIRHGLIALTKSDLVDPDLLDLARLEVEEFVHGSFLENAPIVSVSAITGAGLDDLASALATGRFRSSRQRRVTIIPVCPIDRSFSMRGHGAVVTGTLIAGTLPVHDEVELYPPNKRARIRGLASSQLTCRSCPRRRANRSESRAASILPKRAAAWCSRRPSIFRATQQIDASSSCWPARTL